MVYLKTLNNSQFMEEWKEYNIGDVCNTISETYKANSSKVVLINTSDILEGVCLNHNKVDNKDLKGQFKKVFHQYDILYSEIRPANKRFAFIHFNPLNYIASTKLMVIRNNERILPEYLYYILQSKIVIDELQMLAESRSGTFPQITFSEVSRIPIKLPPLSIQKVILDILKALDSKIELNRRINDNLEQQAQTLFNYYFIDESTKIKDCEDGSLTDIATYLNGLAMQKYRPHVGDKGLPVLKIKELGQGSCDSNSDLCSSLIKEDYIINNGDIIFSWSGTLMVDIWSGGKCGLNQHLFKVSSNKYPKWFIYFWTNNHLDKFIRIAKDKAVTMGHIKRIELENSKVLIPNYSKMEELNKLFTPLFNSYLTKRIEIKELEKIRDSLLPKLMSGEIKINDLNC